MIIAIPGGFFEGINACQRRYLSGQKLVTPTLFITILSCFLYFSLLVLLVHHLKLGVLAVFITETINYFFRALAT